MPKRYPHTDTKTGRKYRLDRVSRGKNKGKSRRVYWPK